MWVWLGTAVVIAAVVRFIGLFQIAYFLFCTRLGYLIHKYYHLRTAHQQPAHSKTTRVELSNNVYVQIIPFLDDNYAYLIVDKAKNEALVVDPADPDAVLAAAADVAIVGILTTHHHWDHAGGNNVLVAAMSGRSRAPVRVYGGERMQGLTDMVDGQSQITFGDCRITVRVVPCHTRGHVIYALALGANQPVRALFTGDTLFLAGCGKFFEGTAPEMYTALAKIDSFGAEALVFPGHEYSLSNLRFASEVEPTNEEVKRKLREVTAKREEHQPTVPSTLGEERSYNPFLRCSEAEVRSYTSERAPEAVLAVLRRRKNAWKAPPA